VWVIFKNIYKTYNLVSQERHCFIPSTGTKVTLVEREGKKKK